jgi:hypothetical protein
MNWVRVAGHNINLGGFYRYVTGEEKGAKFIRLYYGKGTDSLAYEGPYAEAIIAILDPVTKPIGPDEPPPKKKFKMV